LQAEEEPIVLRVLVLGLALAFAAGAALPLVTATLVPDAQLVAIVAGTSLVFLAGLGALSARLGGAPVAAATLRITFWGAIAMLVTAAVGRLFGTVL